MKQWFATGVVILLMIAFAVAQGLGPTGGGSDQGPGAGMANIGPTAGMAAIGPRSSVALGPNQLGPPSPPPPKPTCTGYTLDFSPPTGCNLVWAGH